MHERVRQRAKMIEEFKTGAPAFNQRVDKLVVDRQTYASGCADRRFFEEDFDAIKTDNGEIFDVPFADDAEIPSKWPCKNGMEGTLLEGAAPEEKKAKPPRTHWDMLLERRSEEELEVLLNERLDLLKKRRRG